MSKVLVTGGAGYIGSHIVRMLVESGREVVVVDDLSEGHREALGDVPLTVSDFGNAAALEGLLSDGSVDYVVHMAAYCEVGQSVVDPASYYHNNLVRSLSLFDAAVKFGVRGIVFSSTAAVYGEPDELPITESHPQKPTNPYGETKLACERALSWYHGAYGLRSVSLRYFNAAGAHPDADIGEDHANETHLIPRLIQAVVRGSDPIPIFGEDYPTPDGTCVRDYVHVADLAQAHVLALDAMQDGSAACEAFNLGNGEGFSVRQVVDTIARVTGHRCPTRSAPRRAGDPATLVASSARIAERLGWRAAFPTLEEIVRTAWNWHRSHPHGFGTKP
jgi:UDP-glucose 4-epimerase